MSIVDIRRNVLALGNATSLRSSVKNERNEPVDCIGVIVVHVLKIGSDMNITPNTCCMWPIHLVQKVVLVQPSNELVSSTRDPSASVPRPQSELSPSDEEDRVMNYGLQVLQLGVLLMQLNDTEEEGDGEGTGNF